MSTIVARQKIFNERSRIITCDWLLRWIFKVRYLASSRRDKQVKPAVAVYIVYIVYIVFAFAVLAVRRFLKFETQ
jgi:hypothetical protein|tara:strand:+ start:13831 stop:14055 length:225 start_codon:yes stop_codon:yes gene_type:complete